MERKTSSNDTSQSEASSTSESDIRSSPQLMDTDAFNDFLKSCGSPPASYRLGDDLDWNAPWVEIKLQVELPFWLFVENTTLQVEVGGHEFPVSIHMEYFELYANNISDSKNSLIYQGKFLKDDEMPENIQEFKRLNPTVHLLWRKAKSVLTITTRCNEDVWLKRTKDPSSVTPQSVILYFDELCRAHIPVLNKLVQGYRLATYDPFAFEVAPWDVPYWMIKRDSKAYSCILVPYKTWDHPISKRSDGQLEQLKLTNADSLRTHLLTSPHPGELELLDAINFMERGNYSDAIRRITTAIEAIVCAVTEKVVSAKEGPKAAKKFIKDTRVNFYSRIQKYTQLSGRVFPDFQQKILDQTRKLRHRIVHTGYRISPAERGLAQKYVDCGRWMFNWFENDAERCNVRERQIVLRSLGREMTYNIFKPQITPEGVTLSQPR